MTTVTAENIANIVSNPALENCFRISFPISHSILSKGDTEILSMQVISYQYTKTQDSKGKLNIIIEVDALLNVIASLNLIGNEILIDSMSFNGNDDAYARITYDVSDAIVSYKQDYASASVMKVELEFTVNKMTVEQNKKFL